MRDADEMDHAIRAAHGLAVRIRGEHVADHGPASRRQTACRARPCQRRHLVPAREKLRNQATAHEAGAAGDEYFLSAHFRRAVMFA